MFRNKSINVINIQLIAIIVVTIIVLSSLWISGEIRLFNNQIQNIKNDYINNQKSTIRNQVDEAVNYVKYKQRQTEKRLKADIKSRTYEEYDIAMNIYNNNKNTKSSNEIKKMITDALRNIRFNNNRGYYFIDTLEGEAVLYVTEPKLEGKSILNMQDDKGNFPVKDEINLVKKQGEGEVTGYWKNPEYNDGRVYPKVTYVKKFEPYNWYMGTGEYVENVKRDIQKECLNRISEIRYGSSDQNYIFIDTFDGVEICNDVYKNYVGKNIWNLKDARGAKVIQEQIEIAKSKKGEGFLFHHWSKSGRDETFTKLTFVQGVSEWNWVVGTGVNMDEVKEMVKGYELQTKKRLVDEIISICLAVILVLIAAFMIAKGAIKKLKNNFNIFTEFFYIAATKCIMLDVEKLSYQEFKTLAITANKMLGERNRFEEELKLKTEELKLVSITDGLTQMYNHKFICEALKDKIENNKERVSVLMLDIDLFKKINDTYGHQCGDEVLVKVASIIKSNITPDDMVGRYGGEEFMVIFCNKSIEDGFAIAETIRNKVMNSKVDQAGIRVTISGGMATFDSESLEELVKKADKNLYKAKANGRNKIEK